MGTNYYRIPTVDEVEQKRKILLVQIETMQMEPSDVENGFRFISPNKDWEWFSPWDIFTKDLSIHLGKRSMGWKFCWNFHDNKYYTNKQELIDYVLSGRVVDEYGEEMNQQEFLDMAFDWGEPDGLTVNAEYYEKNPTASVSWFNKESYYDRIIDGLRVSSSTEFS